MRKRRAPGNFQPPFGGGRTALKFPKPRYSSQLDRDPMIHIPSILYINRDQIIIPNQVLQCVLTVIK